MLQPSTVKFLKDLKKNNSKEWFDANLTDKNLVKKIITAFEVLQPMITFINRALE